MIDRLRKLSLARRGKALSIFLRGDPEGLHLTAFKWMF